MSIASHRRAGSTRSSQSSRAAHIIVCVLLGTICTVQAYAEDFSNAAAEINSLEETLSGQVKAGLPLLGRVDALETLTFGQPSTGALKDRITRLRQFLGGKNLAASTRNLPAKNSASHKTQTDASKVSQAKKTSTQISANQNLSASSLNKSQSHSISAPLETGSSLPALNAPKQAKPPVPNSDSSPAAETNTDSPALETSTDLSGLQHNVGRGSASLPGRSWTAPTAGFRRQGDTGAEADLQEQSQVPPIKYPEPLQKLMTEAISLYHSGKLDEAKGAFENIFARYPDCVDACYDLACLAEKRGDTEAAIIYYSRAQYLAPEDEQIKEAVARLNGQNQGSTSNGGLADSNGTLSDTNSAVPAPANPAQAGAAPAQMPPSQGQANYGQALQTAVNAGRSILNYTLNRALSSMHNF